MTIRSVLNLWDDVGPFVVDVLDPGHPNVKNAVRDLRLAVTKARRGRGPLDDTVSIEWVDTRDDEKIHAFLDVLIPALGDKADFYGGRSFFEEVLVEANYLNILSFHCVYLAHLNPAAAEIAAQDDAWRTDRFVPMVFLFRHNVAWSSVWLSSSRVMPIDAVQTERVILLKMMNKHHDAIFSLDKEWLRRVVATFLEERGTSLSRQPTIEYNVDACEKQLERQEIVTQWAHALETLFTSVTNWVAEVEDDQDLPWMATSWLFYRRVLDAIGVTSYPSLFERLL